MLSPKRPEYQATEQGLGPKKYGTKFLSKHKAYADICNNPRMVAHRGRIIQVG
jgi:hypothetical protein